ncbi:DMT family transporter [Cochlodiniinecator piscidefendens]|uniref:DMT family transporter n=1 Tax=Cochlodiniinecator piscidefendens TaxID=2715756 RepID=UPI00140E8490|nr:DMT family transporter [Cochlodiniinecator piscidefendens]
MTKYSALSDNAKGCILMMLSMAFFTFNDTFMKLLSADVPLFQALFFRSIITVVLMAGIAHRQGALHLKFPKRDRIAILVRTSCEVATAYLFLTALFHMPLANLTAILQALPLTIALAGAVFLKEPIGWRRMIAILIGLVGVLLIVRPGPSGFDFYSIYALLAVGMITIRDLVARRLSRETPSMTVALSAAIGVLLFSGGMTLGETWATVEVVHWMFISAAALCVVGGYLFSVMVMRQGDIGLVAPFRYTGLLWALVLGFFVFGDWPDAVTLLGALIVVLMGAFTFYRERQLARQA